MGILGDLLGLTDHAAERAHEASQRRKVEKMRPPKVTSRHHPAPPASSQPHACGARCGHPAANGGGCPSTVRGGVCPCSYC